MQRTPELEAEARRWLAHAQASSVPATPRALISLFERLLTHYRASDFNAVEARLMAQDFVADFAQYSVAVMAETCATWRRTSKWRPSNAELLAIAEPLRREEARRLREAQALVDWIDRPAALPAPDAPATPPEVNLVEQLAERLRRKAAQEQTGGENG